MMSRGKLETDSGSLDGRLFLALTPPAACRAAIENWIDARSGGRGLPGWPVPPERWHLTLKFLGDTSRRSAEQLCAALDSADLGSAFFLQFAGLGAFPAADRAKVLWIGCDKGAKELKRLAGAVDRAAVVAGFEAEPRPYRPHLTLSRLRAPQDFRSQIDRASEDPGSGMLRPDTHKTAADLTMRAETIWLYRSHLGHRSVRYERLRSWTLG
jgi:2'-5' RNA ligase